MARQRAKSSLAAKLGGKLSKAVDTHKGDETSFGSGGDLPAGIEGGIAQLVDCRFSQYKTGDNKGEFFFLAAGIVISPTEHDGIPIQGLRAQIMEPICDVPNSDRKRKTVDDQVEWILNELRKLGADTAEATEDDLETLAAALKEDEPYFRLRTWKGDPTEQYPNPRVNIEFRGSCDYVPDEEGNTVSDATGKEPSDAEEVEPEDTEANELSLAELGALADAEEEKGDDENNDARVELEEKAKEVGVVSADFDTWAEVAEAMEAQPEESNEGDASQEESEEEEDDWAPEKEEIYNYKPPRMRKLVVCEVTSVNESKQTVTLKGCDSKKFYKDVPWDKLEDTEEEEG